MTPSYPLHSCTPILSTSSSTTFYHLFLSPPLVFFYRWLLLQDFSIYTILIFTQRVPQPLNPLTLTMRLMTDAIAFSFCSSFLNLLFCNRRLVHPIVFNILFSKVLVFFQTAIGGSCLAIIFKHIYTLDLVFLENTLDFKYLLKANDALSAYSEYNKFSLLFLAPLFFVLSTAFR